MEPTVVDDPPAGRFEILVDGQVVGHLQYQRQGDTFSLTHTAIEPDFEGRGLGSKLAGGALATIRDQGGAVLPFCPFIRAYLQRHPEYLDLVPPDQRSRFQLPAAAEPETRRP